MSDLETTTTETPQPTEAEGAQQATTPESAPPWGDDFNPERAWSTIQTQREAETKLKEQVQELSQYRDYFSQLQNPETQADMLARLGLELESDEPQYEDPDDDPSQQPLTRAEFEQWQRAQQEEANSNTIASQITDHIDQLAKESKLKLSDDEKEFLFFKATSGENLSPDNTQSIFSNWASAQKQALDGRFNEYRDQKLNAPHVSTVGSQATDEVLPLDATPSQRVKFMTERALMAKQQQ